MENPNPDDSDTLIGKRALHQKIITPDQLREAMAEQARDLGQRKTGPRPLAAILVSKGFLSQAQVQSLLLSGDSAGAGAVPFGKYRLVRELGRGGMGVVYEALDVALGRKVALKTMIPSPHANPEETRLEAERFLREAQLAASLPKHPHIVGVYEVGVIDGKRYMAMELVEGLPMNDWVKKGQVPLRQEVAVLRDAALAVQHAHQHGIIHRDLKPANILVDARNQPHVTDFGLAKLIGQNLGVSLTGAGMVVGTPAYISPEQAQGSRTTDGRTDVYALGVILYEVLTGRQPFQGETAMEILMRAAKHPVPPPTGLMKIKLAPEQAQGLENICLKALAKNPQNRYRDAASFAADLTRWLEGGEIKVVLKPDTVTVRASRPWIPFALVGVLAAAGLAWFVSTRSSEPSETRKAPESHRPSLPETTFLPPAKEPATLRPGLVGEYFGGSNFDIPSLRKIDPEVSFQWKTGPAWTNGPSDCLSIRWRGYLSAPETGAFIVQVRSNDGVRLFIDGTEVILNWTLHPPTTDAGACFLEKGIHSILLEYFRVAPGGGIRLSWKRAKESGAPLAPPEFSHDPSTFAPLSQPAVFSNWDWSAIPEAQEAEAMPILEGKSATTVIPFGRNKGVLIWGHGTKLQDRLKVRFQSTKAGKRTLILSLLRSRNSGIFRITLNGTPIADSVDLFYGWTNHYLEMEFKDVELRQGANDLEFTAIRSNPAAAEAKPGEGVLKLGFDYLRFRN